MLTCVKNRFDPSSVSSNQLFNNIIMQENPVESHKGACWKPTFYYLGRYFCVLWNSTKIALKTKCISIVCCKHKLSTTVIIKVMRLSMKATIFPNELYYRTIVFLLQTRCFYCISHWGNCKTSMKIHKKKRLRRYEPSRTEPSPDFGNPHNKSGWATDFILQYVRPYVICECSLRSAYADWKYL